MRQATLRLTEQVSHLTQLVLKMQTALNRLDQENFALKQALSLPLINSELTSVPAVPAPLIIQPSPIKLFSSSPTEDGQDDFVMSYFCNSPTPSQAVFKSEASPMMGYQEDLRIPDSLVFNSDLNDWSNLNNLNSTNNLNFIDQPVTSTKTLTISQTTPLSPAPFKHRKVTRKPSGPLKILIVEDDPLCQRLISHIIKSLHVGQCEVVADGVEAVINMSTNTFDLILMDMQLPHLDGLQATQNIRKFNRRTPIVSMTARVGEDDVRRYFEGGIDEVLPKPFDKQSVRRIIEQFYKLSINEDSMDPIDPIEEIAFNE